VLAHVGQAAAVRSGADTDTVITDIQGQPSEEGGDVDLGGAGVGVASDACGSAGSGDGIVADATGWTTLTLEPGRYELLCNLRGPYGWGMYTLLDVML
jgi:hypothetical protein